jgi:PPOX class probable F420-dependent enzyme
LKRVNLSGAAASHLLRRARIAHLATVNQDGSAHVIPIVFATARGRIYFAVDKKPKRKAAVAKLRRIQNIRRTGRATFLIDEYNENWARLRYLLVYCKAELLKEADTKEREKASRLLKAKYPQQYLRGKYFPEDSRSSILVRLTPTKIVFWQARQR